MKYLNEAHIEGKRALIRVDFNVPLNEQLEVTEDNRIREAIPTIKYILDNGGSCVLMSHLGRPKGGPEDKFSLRHTVSTIQSYVNVPVHFAPDCVGEESFALSAALKPGEILLLENLRFYKQEEAGDEAFAQQLARHGDFYVNDAFGTAHRAHASTTIVAKFFEEKYCGFLLQRELENADRVIKHAEKPVCAIVGGAKVSDKILMIENLMDRADYILIGGGMAFTFLKAKGYNVGKSLLEADKVAVAAELYETANKKGVRLLTPVDSVISDIFGEGGKVGIVRNEDFPDDSMGLDIGPKTFELYYDVILASKTILWNGPMGVFEMDTFAKGTLAVAHAVVEATEKGAFSLIGGGDSAAAIAKAGMEDRVSYVSTGGGALLEYLEGKVLPGVAALG
ncbi:MAG: phosphoglycerate kinase [Bacteroidetes bacterium]|nr:MAG: phosphoglycerate kinase [Bacteroidota bacterium]